VFHHETKNANSKAKEAKRVGEKRKECKVLLACPMLLPASAAGEGDTGIA
jgi:hypothetical protein